MFDNSKLSVASSIPPEVKLDSFNPLFFVHFPNIYSRGRCTLYWEISHRISPFNIQIVFLYWLVVKNSKLTIGSIPPKNTRD